MALNHHRKYETTDKLMMYALGVCVTLMLAMQTNYSSKQTEYTSALAATASENHDQLIMLNLKMTHSNTKLADVEQNQKRLQTTVGQIGAQVQRDCERNNLYWMEHKVDCGGISK